ncbi:Glycosyl phosphatidyl inositol anchor synthesis [Physocladia obscura]|uniref:GPI ethanolamine phosphate transferase 1 n=1 Tax=Physocladia obscura TaxID=109957 RepID=A0AAD5T0F9_9FUNG|nr:Glycosyl phosphatidyl inositol anchor synthesis [Physocladia obscura]
MSNRGNHGDGHPDNTETPLIAWGAGIAGPKQTKSLLASDEHSISWNLDFLHRQDVNQADVAPLMSTVLGLPFPMNSVGELPLEYLDNTEIYKAEAAFRNAEQILRQFLVKQESKRRTELYFVPFQFLENHDSLVSEIRGLIERNLIELAEEKSIELARLCIEGLRYYQTYDWLFLRSMISVGYVGWILNKSKLILFTAIAVFASFSIFLFLKESPFNYHLYSAFLVYLWSEVFKQRKFAFMTISRTFKDGTWFKNLVKAVAYVFALEMLVFSYFRREILTPSLIIAGFVWPLLAPEYFRAKNFRIVWFWQCACLVTSIFTMLPVENAEDIRLVTLGGVLVLVSGIIAAYLLPRHVSTKLPTKGGGTTSKISQGTPPIILFQLLLIGVSIIVVNDTSARLKKKEGLPVFNQILSWLILFSCGIIPLIDLVKEGQHFLRRLLVIYLSFAPVFVLLSVSYETLFYFCFAQTLLGWLLMERQLFSDLKSSEPLGSDYQDISRRGFRKISKLKSSNSLSFRLLTADDLRIATIFLFLINVAFFGTGNIASVSSFSVESVYRFITVFNPILMGVLLIFKILVPFFLLSAVFGVISRSINLPAFSLFLLVLSTTDVMTLNFFFLVRDNGSWLEIGTTISHFMIASIFIVFQIILFTVGHFLVGKVLIPEIKSAAKSE